MTWPSNLAEPINWTAGRLKLGVSQLCYSEEDGTPFSNSCRQWHMKNEVLFTWTDIVLPLLPALGSPWFPQIQFECQLLEGFCLQTHPWKQDVPQTLKNLLPDIAGLCFPNLHACGRIKNKRRKVKPRCRLNQSQSSWGNISWRSVVVSKHYGK